MPVPVPRHSKPCAHPVVKPQNRILTQAQQTQETIGVSPVLALGFPAQLGPAEELASWGRIHAHSSWDHALFYQPPVQDFIPGLTASGDVSVIKGAHAEACIPPMHALLQDLKVSTTVPAYAHYVPKAPGNEGDIGSGRTHVGQGQSQSWNVDPSVKRHITQTCNVSPLITHMDSTPSSCLTPILEDHSPGSASGPDGGSSPLEPLTPFADFVDRAINAATSEAQQDISDSHAVDYYQGKPIVHEETIIPVFPTIADVPRQHELPVIAPPSATVGYKKLVESLSEWIANYVWKVCTTGYSLPLSFSQSDEKVMRYPVDAPSHLAPCVKNVLLATLLQPSAVFLALWYIVRLPVYFGAASLNSEIMKAAAGFQTAFLNNAQQSYECEVMENSTPLRLIVLGFMLANKWLDDHTFSNKTWHTISGIPVQVLNALESYALDVYSYDLSISNQQWSQWLDHVLVHHNSLTSPGRPQPISRPSSNPHTIVRRAIEEIMQASVALAGGVPQPVFLGFEERLHEKMEKASAMAIDVLEIDLDEDGPLREEYLPKRRSSKVTSQTSVSQHVNTAEVAVNVLPPPAKWSPAGDEPILRERKQSSGQYLAVRAPHIAPAVPGYPLLGQTPDAGFNQNWMHAAVYMPVKQIGYPYIHLTQQAYHQFDQTHNTTLALTRLRSQSLSYDQDPLLSRTHMRSYSQTGFGAYRFNNLGNEHPIPVPEMETRWMDVPHYPYSGPAFVPLPAIGLQPAW